MEDDQLELSAEARRMGAQTHLPAPASGAWVKRWLAVGMGLVLLIVAGLTVSKVLADQRRDAEAQEHWALVEEGRRRAEEAEARKTPEQRAREAAEHKAQEAKQEKERLWMEKTRNQAESLFSVLRMSMGRSSLVASEMAEQNTLNSYFRKRDRELAQSLQASRQETARAARIYESMDPTLKNSPLGAAVYSAQEYCEYSAKAAKAWMAYFQTFDAEDRDQAKLAIRHARQAENDFKSNAERVLNALR